MKKLLTLAIVALTMLATGCNNKSAQSESNQNVSDSVAIDETAVVDKLAGLIENKDAEGLKATIEEITKKYGELVNSGKLEEAKSYVSQVKDFIKTHSEELENVVSGNETLSGLISTVKNLPSDAKTTAEEAAAAVKENAENAAKSAVDEAKAEAESKVDEAKAKAQEKAAKAINDTKEKAQQAVDDANKKAAESINKAADKLLKH